MAMRLVRLGGLVTILVLGVTLWLFWRRERRRRIVPPTGQREQAGLTA
jgi:hypothetical protein